MHGKLHSIANVTAYFITHSHHNCHLICANIRFMVFNIKLY